MSFVPLDTILFTKLVSSWTQQQKRVYWMSHHDYVYFPTDKKCGTSTKKHTIQRIIIFIQFLVKIMQPASTCPSLAVLTDVQAVNASSAGRRLTTAVIFWCHSLDHHMTIFYCCCRRSHRCHRKISICHFFSLGRSLLNISDIRWFLTACLPTERKQSTWTHIHIILVVVRMYVFLYTAIWHISYFSVILAIGRIYIARCVW